MSLARFEESGERVAVVGAGSWGTALANLLAGKGVPTIVWSYEQEVAEAIQRDHRNPRYLQDVPLDPSLKATADLDAAIEGATAVISVSPSHVVRGVMARVGERLGSGVMVISASKGIEEDTLDRMDEVLRDVLPDEVGERLAFLSGPSFALEVGHGYPTAVTMAARSEAVALRAQELFQTDTFRVYTNSDVIGVEIGGSLKNVIAIASGVVDGLGFGHNTRAALITRGLAEMTRLGVALGADPLTFSGLAGMGDLILTCTGGLSRNRTVGMELASGQPLQEILAGMTMIAEGVRTTRSARDLARRAGVEMPIVEAVYGVLYEDWPPREAVENLMLRAPKAERWG